MPRLLLILALLAILIFADKPERTLFWDTAFDAGHVPLFGVIALLARGLVASRRPGRVRPSVAAFFIAIGIGAASELAQLLVPGRDASWGDFARNAAGAAGFLLARQAWRASGHTGRWRRSAATLVAVLLVGVALSDLADVSLALIQRARAFPTLARLDGARWERRIVHPGANRLTPARPDHPHGYARIDLLPGTYSGFSLNEPSPDWRGYQALVIPVYSDLGEPLGLTVRIHDAAHDQRYEDRYNATFQIAPGLGTVRIPLYDVRRAPADRDMDLSRVRGLMCFVHRLDHPVHLFVGAIRLE